MARATSKAAARLAIWLTDCPDGSQYLKVITRGTMGATQTILELAVAELEGKTPTTLAERIFAQCESWADTVGRECVFTCQYLADSDRPTSTCQFRVGPMDGNAIPVDGSPESFILQLQATIHQKDRLFIDLIQGVSAAHARTEESYQQVIAWLAKRIDFLERGREEVDTLKDELLRSEANEIAGASRNQQFDRLAGIAERLLLAKIKETESGKL